MKPAATRAAELAAELAAEPYAGYVYAYPHKTAYRPIEPAVPLAEVWAEERKDALFLYAHIPFCRIRCGFCNLFALNGVSGDLVSRYLEALERQAERVAGALGPERRFARVAIGGGTPTFLAAGELSRLFDVLESILGADARAVPAGVEASPDTVDADKLAVLRERGVDRLSIGVQSFFEGESRSLGRPQRRVEVERALGLIRDAGFPTLNIDLIYGGEGQTPASWLDSVAEALRYQPEELYLYPLYVRQLTGLGKRQRRWSDERLAAYRAARDLLLAEGYEQVSMRMFRSPRAPDLGGPVYCCQEDGMVGLGAGARSYTRRLHYSSEYAVGRSGVADILEGFITQPGERLGEAGHGFWLDGDERRRRYLIQSLLQCEGLSVADYRRIFSTDPLVDRPELAALCEAGFAEWSPERLRLTAAGIELSDAIGPWLFSHPVRARMEDYSWR